MLGSKCKVTMLVIKQLQPRPAPSSPEVDSVFSCKFSRIFTTKRANEFTGRQGGQAGVISVLTSRQLCEADECWSSVLYSLALGEQKSESYKGKVCQSDQFPRQRERPVQSSPAPVLSLLSPTT